MKFINALVAAAVLTVLAAAPAQADTVDVRIEGDGVSLQKTVEVPSSGEVFSGCPYDTAAGAIEVATEGNWDRSSFTSTILGESHTYSERDYWNFWFNRESSQKGICDASQPLQDGDEVLMIVQREDTSGNPAVFPLFITSAPASAERGQPAQVTVREHRFSYSTTTSTKVPAEGATVAGCGASATTGSDGVATITCEQSGAAQLVATKPQRARSQRVPIVVTEPGQPAPPPPPPAQQERRACFTNGTDGRCGTRDLQAPVALITSIRNNARFRRRSAPRALRGTAGVLGANELLPDGSGILMIKLRLTRSSGGRCSTWSSRTERFVPRRCGAENGFWFKVGEAPDWDYLLPARLGPGRYVLDADAIDRAGNRLRVRRRGENRVVFRVR